MVVKPVASQLSAEWNPFDILKQCSPGCGTALSLTQSQFLERLVSSHVVSKRVPGILSPLPFLLDKLPIESAAQF